MDIVYLLVNLNLGQLLVVVGSLIISLRRPQLELIPDLIVRPVSSSDMLTTRKVVRFSKERRGNVQVQ